MTVKEKMTAPIASVGADVEQPLQNFKTNQSIADLPGKGNLQATNNAENTAKSANKKNPDDLETVSMMELYDTAYPPKLPIIDGLLYNGTYLFVGSPKIGKSFFMAQIGYHISKGLPLWGFSVRQGTVLYLALEDDYARLQKRLSQMFGMEGSENFYFATKSKSLNDGLERQLVTFVTEHKDARLIIIDNRGCNQPSAKKVRCAETGNQFVSLSDAARAVGLRNGNSIRRAIDRGGTAGGYHWEYLDEKKEVSTDDHHQADGRAE